MASKKTSRGKRYTDQEKQNIIDFVEAHNAKNGRGGAAQASRKFKVSQLTVGAWLKKSKGAGAVKAKAPAKVKAGAKAKTGAKRGRPPGRSAKAASTGRSSILGDLNSVDREISEKRKELSALEAKFDKLIASL